MDAAEFRQRGREMVDYIANYLENIRERNVVHSVSPGYLRDLLPEEAPRDPENFDDVFKDIERVIMPGVTHWHSPYFHGYFAPGSSYPSILGDMLSDAIGCIGFSWATSPACTELEVTTTDWLGKMIGLPNEFLHCTEGPGGGVIQSTASETVLLCLLAARTRTITKYKKENPEMNEIEIISKLVGYCSTQYPGLVWNLIGHIYKYNFTQRGNKVIAQANSSVERSGLLGAVQMVKLDLDDKHSVRGETLRQAIERDKERGRIPFFMCASLGTTGTCAFDNLEEIGPICKEEGIWLHIDAAYAGSAFVCPEFRHFMKGIEYAETISINPHKWMLINFDLSVMWIRDSTQLVDAFNVDPVYLKHANQGKVPDYRHWQIPLGRRFRALKLWFMLRSYGVSGVQKYIRKHVNLAKMFEKLVKEDGRFEIVADVVMGLVCFRIKGPNELTERLMEEIIEDRRIFLIPAFDKNVYFLRFAICAERTNSDDIQYSFSVVRDCATNVLALQSKTSKNSRPVIDIDQQQRDTNQQQRNDKLTRHQQESDEDISC